MKRPIVLESPPTEGRTLFGSQRKHLAGHVRDLKDLTFKYAKQETVDPLKSLGRFLMYGTIGSFFIGTGVVLLTLAALRALQTETGEHLTDHLSWIPYALTLIGCAAVIGFAWYAIFTEKRRSKRKREAREAREGAEGAL